LKKAAALIVIVALLSCLGVYAALGSAGGPDDPLVSLGYLNTVVREKLLNLVEAKIGERLNRVSAGAEGRLEAVKLPQAGFSYAPKFTPLDFDEGGKLTLGEFGCFILFAGTGRLYVSSGEVIDISTGTVCKNGELLRLKNKYFAAEQSSAYIRLYTNDAWGMVDGYYVSQGVGEVPLRESFLDVDEEHWAAPHIFALAEAGIVRGVGGYKFAPSAAVTRGTFVTIIGRICGVDAAAYTETGFADTDISQWYGPYVAWAAGAGLVLGDGEKFYPDAAITREQMAVIIVRLAGYLGLEAAPGPEGSRPYADAAAVSPWAAEAVVKARDMGIMTGRENDTFDPGGTATRAEFCAVARRLMSAMGKPVAAGTP